MNTTVNQRSDKLDALRPRYIKKCSTITFLPSSSSPRTCLNLLILMISYKKPFMALSIYHAYGEL